MIDDVNDKIMHSDNNYDAIECQLQQEERKNNDMNNYEIAMMNVNANNDHCSPEVNNDDMHNNVDNKEIKLIVK